MAVVGTIAGLRSGILAAYQWGYRRCYQFQPALPLCLRLFAYEGWIIATSINAELIDAKKNLPKALTLGTLFVALIYILYYTGLAGAVETV